MWPDRPEPRQAKPRGPGDLLLSLRARFASQRLDRRLAAGDDPVSDPLLESRARQLTSTSRRSRLARSLADTIRRAHRPARQGPIVLVQRGQVDASHDTLLELAERLSDHRPVDVQGVAMVRLLLTDGRSPIYFEQAPHTLCFLARRALFALDPPARGTLAETRPAAAGPPGW
jgi:hypothetical protein